MKNLATNPDDIHLHLKRLMYKRHITAKILSVETKIPYNKLTRTLQSKREFTAGEIKSVAQALQITDINKYFLGGE